MAVGTVANRGYARRLRQSLAMHAIGGIRPTRLILAMLVGAFVLAMLYVVQIQSLVALGAEIRDLEYDLEIELRQQEALRADYAALDNYDETLRRAQVEFHMIEPDVIRVVQAPNLPQQIDLSPPPWAPVPTPDRLTWLERILADLHGEIDRLKQP